MKFEKEKHTHKREVFLDNEKEILFLKTLAEKEISRIKGMEQPVVRVCGPLTAGDNEGYLNNADRLTKAEDVLRSQGMTVWDYGEAEKDIEGKGFDHGNIFDYFS